MPKAMIVVDPRREKIAVAEAQGAGIPVIALSGTDCDVSKIEYPIVANDSSVSSINFFISEISKAYKKGKVAKKAI